MLVACNSCLRARPLPSRPRLPRPMGRSRVMPTPGGPRACSHPVPCPRWPPCSGRGSITPWGHVAGLHGQMSLGQMWRVCGQWGQKPHFDP